MVASVSANLNDKHLNKDYKQENDGVKDDEDEDGNENEMTNYRYNNDGNNEIGVRGNSYKIDPENIRKMYNDFNDEINLRNNREEYKDIKEKGGGNNNIYESADYSHEERVYVSNNADGYVSNGSLKKARKIDQTHQNENYNLYYTDSGIHQNIHESTNIDHHHSLHHYSDNLLYNHPLSQQSLLNDGNPTSHELYIHNNYTTTTFLSPTNNTIEFPPPTHSSFSNILTTPHQPCLVDSYSQFAWLYISPLILFIGIIGNLIVVAVISRKAFAHTTPQTYLSAIAIFDNAALFWRIVPQLLRVHHLADLSASYTGFCRVEHFSFYLSSDVAIWLVVCFTLDRLVAVCYPLKKPKFCKPKISKIVILILVLLAIFKNAHVFWTRGFNEKSSIPSDLVEGSGRAGSVVIINEEFVDGVGLKNSSSMYINNLKNSSKRQSDDKIKKRPKNKIYEKIEDKLRKKRGRERGREIERRTELKAGMNQFSGSNGTRNAGYIDQEVIFNEAVNINKEGIIDLIEGTKIKKVINTFNKRDHGKIINKRIKMSGENIKNMNIELDIHEKKQIKNCERLDRYVFYEEKVRPWLAFTSVSLVPTLLIIISNLLIIKALLNAYRFRRNTAGSIYYNRHNSFRHKNNQMKLNLYRFSENSNHVDMNGTTFNGNICDKNRRLTIHNLRVGEDLIEHKNDACPPALSTQKLMQPTTTATTQPNSYGSTSKTNMSVFVSQISSIKPTFKTKISPHKETIIQIITPPTATSPTPTKTFQFPFQTITTPTTQNTLTTTPSTTAPTTKPVITKTTTPTSLTTTTQTKTAPTQTITQQKRHSCPRIIYTTFETNTSFVPVPLSGHTTIDKDHTSKGSNTNLEVWDDGIDFDNADQDNDTKIDSDCDYEQNNSDGKLEKCINQNSDGFSKNKMNENDKYVDDKIKLKEYDNMENIKNKNTNNNNINPYKTNVENANGINIQRSSTTTKSNEILSDQLKDRPTTRRRHHSLIPRLRYSNTSQFEECRPSTLTSTTLMCLGVSVAFVVCVTPSIILTIGKKAWLNRSRDVYLLSKTISNQLSIINHASSFFLYCVTGQRFRTEFIRLFRGLFKNTHHHQPPIIKTTRKTSRSPSLWSNMVLGRKYS